MSSPPSYSSLVQEIHRLRALLIKHGIDYDSKGGELHTIVKNKKRIVLGALTGKRVEKQELKLPETVKRRVKSRLYVYPGQSVESKKFCELAEDYFMVHVEDDEVSASKLADFAGPDIITFKPLYEEKDLERWLESSEELTTCPEGGMVVRAEHAANQPAVYSVCRHFER